MVGYADEYETTVLELTYNYGVTEYTKGNAYAQVGTKFFSPLSVHPWERFFMILFLPIVLLSIS